MPAPRKGGGKGRKAPCPVAAYAREVVDGQIAAGRLVRLACERHLAALKSGGKRGLIWDGDAALHAIAFFGHSLCRQHHEFSVKALDGTVPHQSADSWFAYFATIDDGDDWTDRAVWAKANPSLGVTVKLDDLKRQIDEAKEMPAQQNAIRRLRLNEWTEQVTRWLDMAVYRERGALVL